MAKINKTTNGRGRPASPFPPAKEEPAESGRDAFMRIAEKRMNSLLTKLNTLSKMASGKSKYGYTDSDVEHIRLTLVKAVNATADRLRRKSVPSGFTFEKGADADA